MPSPTVTGLIPPKADYLYFEGARERPFQPLADEFSIVNAWWLAEVSMLAYGSESFIRPRLEADEDTLPSTLDLRVFTDDDHGAQCSVISGDQFAILAFRGTRVEQFPDPIKLFEVPFVDTIDLWTDTNFAIPPASHIHPGFLASFEAVWQQGIPAYLDDTLGGRDGRRAIWFTGHSLGAALATIAADRYGKDAARGLYTFGSPRVGDQTFASQFAIPCFRFVNDVDFVPHLPPSGGFEGYTHLPHTLKFIHGDGLINDGPSILEAIEDGADENIRVLRDATRALNPFAIPGRLLGRTIPGARNLTATLGLDVVPVAPLVDHAPINYVTRIRDALPRP
jgi:hypothetical protein